ncbi:MAG: SIR2 family protein [Clostridium sp.]|nr:SIR2 family protein [Clostridium sp.]
MEIDNRNIFFDNLKRGINLFTGAGFSKLESPDGKKLPDASELCDEICKRFSISPAYSNDLEKLSSILKRNCKDEFQKYLRERFTVKSYNELYDALNQVNIKSFITTNIDNIFQSVIDNSKKYYLNCVTYYGATKKDGQVIEYVPLHGDIRDSNSELYFGKFELSNVGNKNAALFSIMHGKLLAYPTLFWGYGFHDGSVSEVISQVLDRGKQDIWIQCMPGSDNIDFFRDLGCNVIVSTTEELLSEILAELETSDEDEKNITNKIWKKYEIPTINQIESLDIKYYYQLGKTHWYYIITDQAYATHWVNSIINQSLENKNVLVIGIPLGGKTTLLMQIARKYNKQVYYIADLNKEKAKLLCNNLDNQGEKVLLIDNCAEDMEAYQLLAKNKNIKTIATCDDFWYESSKHKIEDVEYKKIIIEDIERSEAQRIYSNIPPSIRMDSFKYKEKETDKYSIFELIATNVKDILSSDKVKNFLEKLEKNDDVFELVLLTSYLVYHDSALSTDIIFKYFDIQNYGDVQEKIRRTQSMLAEIDIAFDPDLDDQDYYTLRSNLFAKITHEVAKKHYKSKYAYVIKNFIEKVSPDYIYKNYVFRRRAYDAELFNDLFDKQGDLIYEMVYAYDSSAYTLQQWALYKSKNGRFKEAFVDIDKAINMQPNNFSIKNARAIILFEANREKNTEEAKKSLYEAMEILEACHKSDKRKVYHAQKYAEFAIYMNERYADNTYLRQAYKWMKELIDKEDSKSYRTRELFRKLKDRI